MLERLLAFGGRLAAVGGDADVLIDPWPVDATAAAQQAPGTPFSRVAAQGGIPGQRRRNRAAIGQFHGEGILADRNEVASASRLSTVENSSQFSNASETWLPEILLFDLSANKMTMT